MSQISRQENLSIYSFGDEPIFIGHLLYAVIVLLIFGDTVDTKGLDFSLPSWSKHSWQFKKKKKMFCYNWDLKNELEKEREVHSGYKE